MGIPVCNLYAVEVVVNDGVGNVDEGGQLPGLARDNPERVDDEFLGAPDAELIVGSIEDVRRDVLAVDVRPKARAEAGPTRRRLRDRTDS